MDHVHDPEENVNLLKPEQVPNAQVPKRVCGGQDSELGLQAVWLVFPKNVLGREFSLRDFGKSLRQRGLP